MKKLKSALLILLTAALIVCGAVLPGAASAAMDHMDSQNPGSAQIQSVQLQFDGSDPSEPLIRKLAIRSQMDTIPITASGAAMTEDEVFSAVESCMDMYVSNGIFSWFEDTYRTAEPYLAINPNDTDEYYVFWAVHIVREDDLYNNLFLHLDDESGKILYLDYVTYDPDRSFFPEDQAYALDALTGIYFEQLGLSEMADPSLSTDVTVYDNIDGADDVWSRRYTFRDSESQGFTIEFYVKPKGFYILFPN